MLFASFFDRSILVVSSVHIAERDPYTLLHGLFYASVGVCDSIERGQLGTVCVAINNAIIHTSLLQRFVSHYPNNKIRRNVALLAAR